MATAPLGTGRLFFEQDMTTAEICSFGSAAMAVFSHRSPDKPTVNEDAAAIFPCGNESAVLIVADGLGGYLGGEKASRAAVLAIQEAVESAVSGGVALRSAILDGLEAANQAVQRIGGRAATTLAAVEIDDHAARPYHVGDSMILIVGGRGKVKLQTVSHSPVGYAVEAGWLDEAEAMHHDQRHLVSNVVGVPEMRIEIGPTVPLAARDTLLLASDGLFDNLHIPEIIDLIRRGPLPRCAARLAEVAMRRMTQPEQGHPSKPDDLTFVLYRRERPQSTKPVEQTVANADRTASETTATEPSPHLTTRPR